MADVVTQLLDAGKTILTSSLIGVARLTPHSFRCGQTANYTPQATDTTVNGTEVFAGNSELIQGSATAIDTARWTLTIPETAGPFSFGNVVLYVADANDNPQPFVEVVFPFQVYKEAATANQTVGIDTAVGNRFVINISVKHTEEADTVEVEVLTPLYSSLPIFGNETDIPNAAATPWNEMVINRDTRTHTPVLAMKTNPGVYWGIPFWQLLDQPTFGHIDGGYAGDDHKPFLGEIIWGNFYLTPELAYKGTVGGGTYASGTFTSVKSGGSYT